MNKSSDIRKRKRQLTRRATKHLCFVISGLIITTFLICVAINTIVYTRRYTERTIRATSETLVHEYALISKYLFDGARSELKQFANNDGLINAHGLKQVSSWLVNQSKNKAEYFTRISFTFPDGTSVSDTGVVRNLSDKNFFKVVILDGETFSVDGPNVLQDTSDPFIYIAIPVYLPDGTLKGAISGSITLSTLKILTAKMNIKNDGHFFIIGDEGKFICHNSDYALGNVYVPDDPEYKDLDSEFLGKVRNGIFETKGYGDREVTVYLEAIEGTNWTCGITVDKQQSMVAVNKLRSTVVMVIIVTLIMVTFAYVITFLILNKSHIWEKSFDPLTELWTRPKFEKEAQDVIDEHPDARYAVVEIDYPGFKFINQLYGSAAADELLKRTANEIYAVCTRRGDLCSRGYADHFYIFSQIESVEDFMGDFDLFVRQIDSSLAEYEISAHIKCGITFMLPDKQFYNAGKTIQELIGEASYAKATIKNNLLQTYAIYSRIMQDEIDKAQRIERYMEKALDREEFFLVYQPKISLKDEKIKGAEALVRWNSPEPKLGALSPADFVPIFERNGFIVKLDFEIYEMVFKFLRRQLDAGRPVVPVSVNMSRNHKNPDKFVKEFVRRFNKYNLSPELIEIEILERSADEDSFNLVRVTELLHKEGFSVAMDDFGSGQSSLNMLNDVPIDVLKFDQNFLRQRKDDSNCKNMIHTLIDLGKQLNKTTLFEGVETEEQKNLLKEFNCDQVQGYFYSKPLPEKEFVEFIQAHI